MIEDYFDYLAGRIHETADEKGFWDGEADMDKIAAKLALVHSEVTEILEALRKSQGSDKVTEEVADVIIRLLDVYDVLRNNGQASSNLHLVVENKMEKNANREPKHGHVWG